ncbi:8869_t:CDS:2 [Ambispora leptoticha]|uniref:8869_t:CDS:1 n=1 Tax=Ambispora leptoticha TaxID=144679 RepID=A0A9N9A1K3_9GLOM|nr:8869_t:CDS:2 [Ambispora leptoticha]
MQYGNYWKITRAILVQNIRQNVIDTAYKPIMYKRVKEFISVLHNKSNNGAKAFDPGSDISFVINCTLALIIFGYHSEKVNDDKLIRDYTKVVQESGRFFSGLAVFLDFFPFFQNFPFSKKFQREVIDHRTQMTKISAEIFAIQILTILIGYTLSAFSVELEKDPVTGFKKLINLESIGNSFESIAENYKVFFIPR